MMEVIVCEPLNTIKVVLRWSSYYGGKKYDS